jgi:hypothetical protein
LAKQPPNSIVDGSGATEDQQYGTIYQERRSDLKLSTHLPPRNARGIACVHSDNEAASVQQKIQKLVFEFLDDHPGVTFKVAMLTVKDEDPALFPEMDRMDESIENADRVAKIQDEILQSRKQKPHLSFEQAWHLLMREKPEVFNFCEAD